ncbi:Hint domain-containing protein, partial [Acidiphilium sp.]
RETDSTQKWRQFRGARHIYTHKTLIFEVLLMSGQETFTYTFTDGSYTDTINVTISTTIATITNPLNIGVVTGQGYPVLSISGTWEGNTITGMVGNSGQVQAGHGVIYDNAIFPGTTSGGGFGPGGYNGNTQGLDVHGLEFLAVRGIRHVDVNLYTQQNLFYDIQGQSTGEITFDSVTPSLSSLGSNACFAEGTRIATTRGEIPVETLAKGDSVLLHDGGTAPVVWIGHRTIEPGRHARPDAVQPVLIGAHAIADNVPARDLVVSPDHAFYFNNTLIPAKALVNGMTIRQIERRSVTYYHVELLSHAILLAENMPAESYLDTGNRQAFENGGVAIALHPEFAQPLREAASCAAFAEHGAIVEQVRMQILDRAGFETTDDAQLRVEYRADGAAIITSRSAVPAEVTPDPRDRRRLGVKIGALRAGDERVALDHPALAQGWHGVEADGRWTDGAAVVPASLLKGRVLTVTPLKAGLRYPVLQQAETRLTA